MRGGRETEIWRDVLVTVRDRREIELSTQREILASGSPKSKLMSGSRFR